MLNSGRSFILLIVVSAILCSSGCEDLTAGRQSRLDDNVVLKNVKQKNKELKIENDELTLHSKKLKERLRYFQGQRDNQTMFLVEVTEIIDELRKLGGVQKRRDRIALEDQFFFKTGSAELTREGSRYLMKIAHELRKIDYLIRIEGHTDSTPVKNPRNRKLYKDNWGLSAARAGAVVRFFQEKGGIPGERLIGVFYGPYKPIAENTKEGNRKNRRVEIRLIPLFEEEELSIGFQEETEFEEEEKIYKTPKSFLESLEREKEKALPIIKLKKIEFKEQEKVPVIPDIRIEESGDEEETEAPVIIQ